MQIPESKRSDLQYDENTLNSITDPAFVVDAEFHVTSFNRAAEQLTGLKRCDVIGQKCSEILKCNICTHSCAIKQAQQLGEKIISHNITLTNSHAIKLNVIAYSTPLFDEDENFLGGVEIFRHVSDTCVKTSNLHLSERILESIADGAFSVDTNKIITSFNRAAEEITGMHRSDAIGKKCYEVFKANICKSSCALQQSIDTGLDIINQEVEIVDVEGDTIPISVTSSVIRNAQFEIIGGVETFNDTSTIERLRSDITLSDSILESIIEGAFSVDTNWLITSFNHAAEEITGISRHDAIGQKCYDVFKADICKSSCALRKAMDTGLDVKNLKINIQDNKGEQLPVRINASVLRDKSGKLIGGVETFRDVFTIEKLRKNLTISDYILNSIGDGAFTVDKDWCLTSFNHAAEEITGFKKEEAIGKKCFDIFKTTICKKSCALKQSIETEEEVVNQRVSITNKNGQNVPINVTTSALRDENGIAIGGVETFRDCSALETLRKQVTKQYEFQDIISKNHKIQRIFSILPNIAKSDSTVLIEGPSGSGKELFAKATHTLSERKGEYIALNCAALPDNLLESELFGYKKGAFTGANTDKLGRFARAEGGTIFLDEIGDISAALQLRLLRVLQEREYEPLGATKTVKADVRVIAASNKNLEKLVKEGLFRDDLFFRLNIIKLVLPPLSERLEDIQILVDHFIQKFNTLKQKNIESASPEVISILMRHKFPGNIRELENIIEYCFVLCHGTIIGVDCLPESLTEKLQDHSIDIMHETATPLSNAEAQTILAALQECKGNRGKTSVLLGIEKTTLWRKMKKYNIEFPVEKKK